MEKKLQHGSILHRHKYTGVPDKLLGDCLHACTIELLQPRLDFFSFHLCYYVLVTPLSLHFMCPLRTVANRVSFLNNPNSKGLG